MKRFIAVHSTANRGTIATSIPGHVPSDAAHIIDRVHHGETIHCIIAWDGNVAPTLHDASGAEIRVENN